MKLEISEDNLKRLVWPKLQHQPNAKKLFLEEFRESGNIEDVGGDEDELFASLRYLSNKAYPILDDGGDWGDWTMEDLLKYFASVVDALRREGGYKIEPQFDRDAGGLPLYWEVYYEAESYMETSPEDVEEVAKQEPDLYWIKPTSDCEVAYVVSKASTGDWIPPKNKSCLPKEIEAAIQDNLPPKYHFWRMEKSDYRRESRDMLIEDLEYDEQSPPLGDIDLDFTFSQKNEEERIVGGIVYEPETYDTDGDWTEPEVIRKAMYYFMENGMFFDVGHELPFTATVLECFQAETDTKKGGKRVPKGSWYMLLRIKDEWVWEKIRDEELKGFSWQGGVFRKRDQTIT